MRRIEEATGVGIVKAVNHGIGDTTRKVEIAQVGGGFIGVKAGDGGASVIIQQTAHVAALRAGIRIRNYVLEAPLMIPAFSQEAIKRTQGKAARTDEIKDACSLQIRGDA